MKPIILTFSGLNSYQEKQTIDFRALGDSGIFGIFGPTGSGKSTILDAITLALYGKVERATNRTQGVMNHHENRLYVSLIFELNRKSERFVFGVERSYVRAKNSDISIRNTVSRLVRLDEATFEPIEILADKDSDVTGKVQELLGLTVDDFTRAVVLPQGKFAEFLSLKGSERRQMLQRLFSLERYGDQLNERLRNRLLKVTNKLTEIESKQVALGDASDEALALIKKEFNAVQELEEKLTKDLKEFEDRFKKLSEIWDLQLEKQKVNQALENIKNKEEGIIILRKKVQAAKEAEGFRHLLSQQSIAIADICQYNEQLLKLRAREKQEKSQYHEWKKSYEEASAVLQEKEPFYHEQKNKYYYASELENELAKIQEEVSIALGEINIREQELTQKEALLAKEQKQIDELKDHIKSYQNRIEQITVPSQEKQVITQTYHQAVKLMELEKELEQDKGDLTECIQVLKDLEGEFKAIEAEFETSNQKIWALEKEVSVENEEGLSVERRWLDSFRKQLDELTTMKNKELDLCSKKNLLDHRIHETRAQLNEQQSKLEKAKGEYQTLADKHQQLQKDFAAYELAGQLKEGDQCPVCGSTEHPAKPINMDVSIEQLASIALQKDELYQKQGTIHAKIGEYTQRLHQDKKDYKEVSESLNELALKTKEIRAQLISIYQDYELTKLEEVFQEKLSEQELKEKALKEAKTKLIELKAENSRTSQLYNEIKQRLTAVKTKCELVQESVSGLEIEYKKVELEYQKFAGSMSIDEAVKRYNQLQLQENELEQLATKVKEASETKSKLDAQFESLNIEVTELKAWVERLKVGQENLNERKQSIHEKLSNILSEKYKSAGEALEEVNNKLKALKETQASTLGEMNLAKEKLDATQKLIHTLTTKLETVNEELRRTGEALEDLLIKSSFNTLADAKGALLSLGEIERFQERINQFDKDLHVLIEQQKRIDAQLKDQEVTKSEWEEIQTQRKELRQKLDQIVANRGAIGEKYKTIKENNAKWKEWETERVKLEEDRQRLAKLQSVLKGNAFVEFIAEQQLLSVATDASIRLGNLTRFRYALELDSTGGFLIRDDANGGLKRPVNTLSGGETFVTSLALALSLSNQIQLKGEFPLEFFFLDEGFGALDPELLDTVMNSLERLRLGSMIIGIISHVPDLKQRINKRILVHSAKPGKHGSYLTIE